jgi:hypothetical protein
MQTLGHRLEDLKTKQQDVHMDTWLHACGYTAKCMRIHGHMNVDEQPLGIDTWLIEPMTLVDFARSMTLHTMLDLA